mgnify:CR=1 FL=1
MNSTDKNREYLTEEALANKIAFNKKKRVRAKIKINTFYCLSLALIGVALLMGNWLLAGSILILWLALALSF